MMRLCQGTSLPEWLQPTACAYDDDIAVSAPSLRVLIPAVAPAFYTIELITGMNLNHQKCYWVQYGSHTCDSLREWIVTIILNLVK